ncbi:MAG: HAMP domain-containing protein [Deltaproteobacteria bacterium]|nr:HAMP domain-containing protein [Deltaproteobacteria bacterium]
MKEAFLRVYAVVGLALFLAFWLVIYAGRVSLVPPPILPEGGVERIHSLMLDPVRAEPGLTDAAAEYGVQLEVAPSARVLAGMNLLERERLRRGELVESVDAFGPFSAVPISDQPLVVLVRPQSAPSRSLAPIMASLMLLLATGVAVYWTMHPLSAQLQNLTDATRHFGEGDMSARASVPARAAAGELAASFNRMARQVQEEVTGREELLQAISHELRTPVARLRFAVELLVVAEALEERERRADAIERDLDDLNELIGELLLFGSLRDEMRSMMLEHACFDDMAEEARADGHAINPSVWITVHPAPELTVLVDRRLFVRALSNLVRNGARYTSTQLEIRAESRTAEVLIWVDDDGPGVPEEDRERVFEPMVRLDAARSRNTGGVGLGLSLVSRIIRAHGGKVRVLDSPLGGARFEISMPSTVRGAVG